MSRLLTPRFTGTFSDNFTRPDGPLGPPWALIVGGAGTPVEIRSNQAAPSSSGSGRQCVAIVCLDSPNMDVSLTLGPIPNADDEGICYRHAGSDVFPAGIGAFAFDHTGQLIHYRTDGTTYAPLGSAVAGDVIRVRAVGTSVTVYKNGVALETVSSPAPTAAHKHAGVYFEYSNSTGRLDDFSATAL